MSTWVFLRGLTRESRHWGDFPSLFEREVPGAAVQLVDLPGNGCLHYLASPTTAEEMAESCRRQLRDRGLEPPYHVLALSLGAMMAVAWAERHPEEVGNCVLISTSLRPFNPFYRRLKPGSYGSLLKLALAGRDPDQCERAVLALTSCREDGGAAVLADWVAYRREYPVSLGNALRQLAAALRYRAPRVRPGKALLLLAGRGDALVDSRCSRQLAAAWQADFAEHPTAGHDLPLDDGPWVAHQVRDWLAGREKPTPGPVP